MKTISVRRLKRMLKESEGKMYRINYHVHNLDGDVTYGDAYMKADGIIDAKEKFIQMCINMGRGTREQILRDFDIYVSPDMPTNW